jgi:uncharacterized lipoprotein YajG
MNLDWLDRFGYIVIASFLIAIAVLAACSATNHEKPLVPPTPTEAHQP